MIWLDGLKTEDGFYCCPTARKTVCHLAHIGFCVARLTFPSTLSRKKFPASCWLSFIDPILMLWDTHDLKSIKTHGLIFETRAGKGRLLVSAVNHAGQGSAAGRWLLQVLLNHLYSPVTPRNALPEDVWTSLKSELHAERTNLVACTWRFKPDPGNEGLSQGWHQTEFAAQEGWKDIRIGEPWESQGYPNLDGWAWYRLSVDIPARWKGYDIFLSFEGVDDLYELYINGKLAGKSGDLATRKDAFNEKKSYNITHLLEEGGKATIAVRVYDWGGAGGIFRPVTLGTAGLSSGAVILK
jgi:hypothetical protein